MVENICKDYCIRYEVEVLRHMDWHKSGILYGNKAVRVSFQMPPPLESCCLINVEYVWERYDEGVSKLSYS